MKKVSLILKEKKGAIRKTAVFMACIVCLFLTAQNLVAQSNDFTVISADKDTVKLQIAAGKTLYNVTLVSGTQSFAFKQISNVSGDMKMPSGATARPGSNLLHPDRFGFDSYSFPDGAIVKVFDFNATGNFKPEKIRIVPKKGAAAIEYNVN